MSRRRKTRNRWLFAAINVLLVLLAAVCALLFCYVSGQLNSIHTAKRWKGSADLPFAQIACFLPVDDTKSKEEIEQFRRTLEAKFVEASLSTPNEGSLYIDSYSAEAKLTVSGEHGSTQTNAIGVGGEFFLFHPLTLRSGSYISERDLMQDRVILDETTAWTLFGSPDVAGQTVFMNAKPYLIAGVIHREDDFASKAAYGDGAGIFLCYDAFHELTGQGITTYEIVLPNVVSGFGLSLVKDNFHVGTGDVIENSLRYSVKNLLTVIGSFGYRSMRNNGVIYPYWENAVRLTEDWLGLLMALMILLLLCPVLSLAVTCIVLLVKLVRYLSEVIPDAAENVIENRRIRKWKARHK